MEFRLDRRALRALENSPEVLDALNKEAEAIRDKAKENARPISSDLSEAIIAEPARIGPDGPEARIGYDKNHPGFVLWWHEVGNKNHPATPHLRPALRSRGE